VGGCVVLISVRLILVSGVSLMSGPDWSLLDGEMDMPKPEFESFPTDDIPWAPIDGALPGRGVHPRRQPVGRRSVLQEGDVCLSSTRHEARPVSHNPGRIAPSIWPDLIYGRYRVSSAPSARSRSAFFSHLKSPSSPARSSGLRLPPARIWSKISGEKSVAM